MGLLIDSNIFIAAERFRQSGGLAALLDQIPAEYASDEALISVITASELELGVHRAEDAHRRERRRAFVEAIFAQFGTVPIDMRVARCHAHLAAQLMAVGQMIGTHDSWIAATGVACGHAIVTANVSEFGRVPGLSVIQVMVPS